MRLARAIHDELVAHALGEAPVECCGLISGRGPDLTAVHPCPNAAASITRYEIDGPEQMRLLAWFEAKGRRLGAIYHSHTICAPEPSETDIAVAFYPDALYLIVGVQDPDWPELRGFWIRDGVVSEEPLEVG